MRARGRAHARQCLTCRLPDPVDRAALVACMMPAAGPLACLPGCTILTCPSDCFVAQRLGNSWVFVQRAITLNVRTSQRNGAEVRGCLCWPVGKCRVQLKYDDLQSCACWDLLPAPAAAWLSPGLLQGCYMCVQCLLMLVQRVLAQEAFANAYAWHPDTEVGVSGSLLQAQHSQHIGTLDANMDKLGSSKLLRHALLPHAFNSRYSLTRGEQPLSWWACLMPSAHRACP